MASKPARKRATQRRFDLKTLRATMESIPRRTLVLWLLAATLGLLMLPLTLITAALADNVNILQADRQAAVQAQTTLPTLAPRVAALNKQLDQVQVQANQIKALNPTLVAGNMAWTSVMAAIGNYDPSEIALDGIGRADGRLVVTGLAASDQAILTYVSSLQQSGAFENVVLQSVKIADSQIITMTVAPDLVTPTKTPSHTPSASPTLNLRDIYEPDEAVEQTYYLGQFQIHTFYPENDVDRVFFLAKAGRYYRISTQALGPGVDTVLTVTGGGITLTNDDAKPGSLYSEVIVPPFPVDTTVTVTIANRGMYGVAQVYTLVIEEILPTATPTGGFSGTTTAGTSTAQTPTGSAAQTTQATATTAAATATTAPTNTTVVQPTAPSIIPTVFFPTIVIPTIVVPTFVVPTVPIPTITIVVPTISIPTPTPFIPTVTPVPPTPVPAPPTNTDVPTTAPTQPASIVSASLSVDTINTKCPTSVKFTGTVSVRGSGNVMFVIEHSDGTSSMPLSMYMPGDGTIKLNDSFSVQGAPGQTVSGWGRIRVDQPQTFYSDQAAFSFVCSNESAAAPSKQNVRALLSSSLGSALNALWMTHAQFVLDRAQTQPKNPTPPQRADTAATQMPLRFVIVLEPKTTTP